MLFCCSLRLIPHRGLVGTVLAVLTCRELLDLAAIALSAQCNTIL